MCEDIIRLQANLNRLLLLDPAITSEDAEEARKELKDSVTVLEKLADVGLQQAEKDVDDAFALAKDDLSDTLTATHFKTGDIFETPTLLITPITINKSPDFVERISKLLKAMFLYRVQLLKRATAGLDKTYATSDTELHRIAMSYRLLFFLRMRLLENLGLLAEGTALNILNQITRYLASVY